jgi:hypothetical protein
VQAPRPPLLPEAAPVPAPDFDATTEFPAPLATQPLRTPAPEITKIRVTPEPVDGFEFERASMWLAAPEQPAEAEPAEGEPTVPAVSLPKAVRVQKAEKPVLSWLDEDDERA